MSAQPVKESGKVRIGTGAIYYSTQTQDCHLNGKQCLVLGYGRQTPKGVLHRVEFIDDKIIVEDILAEELTPL
jgi:S-adenosylhomocysteine hydrolase